jgi:ferredoxin
LIDIKKERTMTTVITEDCIQCGACEAECASGAISMVGDTYVIDAAKCTDCNSCQDVCPTGACQKL